MKLIAGLGNPGGEYAKTRHNTGFRVLNELAKGLGVSFDRKRFKGEYTRAELPAPLAGGPETARELLLLKPQAYMNLSGEVVQPFCAYYKIALPDLLVVTDDVALPVGALRLRAGGSAGGHNGLKDIALRLGSQEFARLRVGVGGREAGKEHPPEDLAGHVLSRFAAEDEELARKAVKAAAEACLCWAGRGLEEAMNTYNARAQ
jgi:PTH1 family peptidyl-tRNA hydrolase